jgi:hypothetical protein
MNEKANEQKSEKFNLHWLCPHTGRRVPAGVAFYNQQQGDYRLKLDVMPEEKMLYLKASSASDNRTRFRVESAVKRGGQVTHRAEIGSGVSKDDEIHMDIGPFSRLLVLEKGA